MNQLFLTENLSIKKLNPFEEKERELLKGLQEDLLVHKYLYPFECFLEDPFYISSKSMYNCYFSIYEGEKAIGYLESIRVIESFPEVELCYALLKEARGKGYMTKVLRSLSKEILLDRKRKIKKVILKIAEENEKSINVAIRSGFIEDVTRKNIRLFDNTLVFEKTKKILRKENKFL